MMNEQINKIIVLSTGRTGTKYFSKILENIGRGEIDHQGKYSRLINIFGNVALCRKFEKISTKIILFLLKKSNRFNSTVDPLLSISHVLLIKQEIEGSNLKILHLVRDPRDFVTSFMNWRKQKLKRLFLHHFVPLWQPSPYFLKEIKIKNFYKTSKFEHFCWIWAYKNYLFEELKDKEDYLLVKMEDLFGKSINNMKTIKIVADFLDLETKEFNSLLSQQNPINRTSQKAFPSWRKWEKNEAKILENYCGKLMRKYGYGLEPEWKELIKG